MKNPPSSQLAPPAHSVTALPDLLLGALLVCAVGLAYFPAINGGLLWDDAAHVTKPELRSLAGLGRIWFELGATQQYYPILHSAFWVEHRLWGDAVVGYHLVNLTLHATAACLLVALLRRLAIPGAWLAAFLFALHPVNVESVAWISEQKNTLSLVFYLAAALAYLRFDTRRTRLSYALALAFFGLALLTKTVTATLPAALLVIFSWRRGHLEWRRDVLPLLPWLALGAIAGLLTAWIEHALIGAQGSAFDLSLVHRGLLAGRVIWFYLLKLLWPANLTFIYPRWTIDTATVWVWLFSVAALALAAALWWFRHRARGPLAAFLFFTGSLFPVLGFFNIFPFIYSFVADHFQYLACLGPLTLAAVGAHVLAARWPVVRSTVVPVVVALLGFLTWRQCHMYHDVLTLYRETLIRNPSCWMAAQNLGTELVNLDRLPEAIADFERADILRPRDGFIHYSLAVALQRSGRTADALVEFERSLAFRADYPGAHIGYASLLRDVSRTDEAIVHYRLALRLKPDFPEIEGSLAEALVTAGRLDEAVAHFQRVVDLKPRDAEAENALGACYFLAGHAPEAILHLDTALRLNPASAQAHRNLGNVLRRTGDVPRALTHYERALQLDPTSAETQLQFGLALRSTGDLAGAITHFEAGLRLQPDSADLHYSLGLALFAASRDAEARPHYETARRLNPSLPEIPQ
jgi:tetratricopeptide (TPR) repeat protein